jgi:nucleoid-associated protein YgaU
VLQNAAGRELDFSEFPLNLPPMAKAPSQPLPAASDKSASAAVVASASSKALRSGGYYVKVRKGDSLWKIARKHYGDGKKWTRILKANRKRLVDPDLIRPGRRLYLP